MALEPVGVQAVIGNLNGFLSGLSKMDSAMQATGRAADSMAKKASNIGGQFMNLGKSVLGVGAIMGGVALGGAVALGAGFVALGKDALGVIQQYERMNASIAALTARELIQNGAAKDFNEALKLAGPLAKETTHWIEQLAIQSPFDAQGVAIAYRTAQAYGFTSEQAKALTESMINFAAATGQGTAEMNSIALALGQMASKGKVSGQELLQLTNAGIGVNKILEGMGFSLEDVEKGLVPVDQFLQAVTDDMNVFGGAAEAQSTTWAGLLNSLSDIKDIALREFFTGIYDALKPLATTVVATLSSPEFMTALSTIGDTIGNFVSMLLGGNVGDAIGMIGVGLRNMVSPEVSAFFVQLGMGVNDFIAKLREFADTVAPYVAQVLAFLQTHWEAIKGALIAIGAVLAGAAIAALIAGIGSAIAALATPITAIIAVAALLGAAWAEDWGGIRTTMTRVWDETLKPALEKLWEWLQENIPLALQTLSDFWTNTLLPAITNVWDWINANLVPLFESLWELLQVAGDLALTALAGLWENVLQPALETVWDFISANVLPILEDVWEFIDANLTPVLKDLATFLGTTLKKAWNGITDAIQGVIKWIDDLIEKIKNIKLPDWLTPGSPTPFEIGLLGISKAARLAGEGIEKLGKSIDDLNIGRAEDLLGMTSGFSSFGGAAATMFKKKTLDPLQQRIDEIDARIQEARKIFEANQDNWIGAAAQRELVRLEEEKLRLAEQYRREQEKITALEEQQQKLAFLRSQLDFIKMIKDEGLNMGEILGGLKLGVDTDMAGLIEAMTRAMKELIAKVQGELDMGSPSRVFMDIGRNIMAGLARGITSTVGNPLDAMRTSLGMLMQAPVVSAAPVLASQSVTFNNTIASGMDLALVNQSLRDTLAGY